jgi:hypothetical protein
MARRNSESEVGYRKPPKHSQFKKGQSGNPKGRPKGSKDFVTTFMRVANERIRITQNGRTRTITKFEATMIQLTNKAASGDMRAIRELHNWSESLPIEQYTIGPPPELHVHFIEGKNKAGGETNALNQGQPEST